MKATRFLRFAAVATVAVAAMMSSCRKDDDPRVTLTDPSDRTQTAYADATAGGSFTFTADAAWIIAVKEIAVTRAGQPATGTNPVEWIDLITGGAEKYEGAAGTFTYNIVLSPNYTGETRKAEITISCGTVSETIVVTQDSKTQSGQTLLPTVTVGAQSGELKAAAEGTATFAVTTTGIVAGETGAVAWFSDAEGKTSAQAPAGISATVSAVANNAATVTMTATAAAVKGTYYFKTTIDGTTSAVATLTIGAEALTIDTGGIEAGEYDLPDTGMMVGMPIEEIDLSDAITGGRGARLRLGQHGLCSTRRQDGDGNQHRHGSSYAHTADSYELYHRQYFLSD